MNAHPDHPVHKQPQFLMLRHLERNPDRFGVKLVILQQSLVVGFFANATKWCYGATALEALDAALAYLVAESLKE